MIRLIEAHSYNVKNAPMYFLIVWSEMIISMSQSNACNYQMYEIDNGINQSKCQNSSPICSVQCWMSGSHRL